MTVAIDLMHIFKIIRHGKVTRKKSVSQDKTVFLEEINLLSFFTG